MTIEDAIRCADLMSLDMLCMENLSGKDMQELGRICAHSLRLTKKLNERFGLEEHHERSE